MLEEEDLAAPVEMSEASPRVAPQHSPGRRDTRGLPPSC